MRVLYVDVSLRQTLGHHFNASQSLVGALRAAGHDVSLAVSSAAQGFEGARCFKHDVYRAMPWDPYSPSGLRKLSRAAREVAREVWPILARKAPHLVYVHSANAPVCAGLMSALDGLFEPKGFPALIVELPYPCEAKANYHYGEQLAALSASVRGKRWASACAFKPVTVNEETSRLLAETIGLRVDKMPSPYVGHGTVQRKPTRALRVGCLGHQNASKGFHLLPEIVGSPLLDDLPVEFVIQTQRNNMEEVTARLSALVARGRHITFIRESLDGEAYFELSNSIDIMLLPYEPRRYVSAISGIAYEALSQGSIIVAPRQTTVGGIVGTYQRDAPLFDAWEADSIAAALRRAVKDFASLARDAAVGAMDYRSENGPDAYANALEEMAAGRTVHLRTSLISRSKGHLQASFRSTFL